MLRSTIHATKVAARATSGHGSVRFMSKEIKFGVEGRAAMLKGVDTLADAVQVRGCLVERSCKNSFDTYILLDLQ